MTEPPRHTCVIDQTRVPFNLGQPWLFAEAPAAGPAEWIKLDHFEMREQCHTNWCWAAVAESVAHYYNASTNCTQCVIANVHLNRKDCCDAPCGSNDDLEYNVPQALGSVLNRFDCDGGADVPDRPAPLDKVQRQISDQRPVCVRLRWSDGRGHFVVITGYVPGTDWLFVEDPLGQHAEVPYSMLSKGYGMPDSEWVDTHYTKPSTKMCACD